MNFTALIRYKGEETYELRVVDAESRDDAINKILFDTRWFLEHREDIEELMVTLMDFNGLKVDIDEAMAQHKKEQEILRKEKKSAEEMKMFCKLNSKLNKGTKLDTPMDMMGTKAYHQLGELSSNVPDYCYITEECGDYWIGHWTTGMGFVNVHFPKETTRPLTDEEAEWLASKTLVIN